MPRVSLGDTESHQETKQLNTTSALLTATSDSGVSYPSLTSFHSSSPSCSASSPLNTSAVAVSSPSGAICSPATVSTTTDEGSGVALTQVEQVEQYKDDIALHTQLQLQLYLEDLEEQEAAIDDAAQTEALQVEAALSASLYPGDNNPSDDNNSNNALQPLHNSSWPASYADSLPTGTATLSSLAGSFDMTIAAEHAHAQSFQQQMLSLEAAAASSQPFPLGMDAARDDLVLGRRHGGLHSLRDEEEEEDDDEECLPPSETKYILYDDHVSPTSIADALVMLNGPLHEVLVGGATTMTTIPITRTTEEQRYGSSGSCSVAHLHPQCSIDRPDSDKGGPIYSLNNATTAALRVYAYDKGEDTGDDNEDASRSEDLQKLERKQMQGDVVSEIETSERKGVMRDFNKQSSSQQENDANTPSSSARGHSTTMGLLSPPTGAGVGQREFFAGDGDVEEDRIQGRPSHEGGPDISLNLAGTMVSPITIHELFFSRYYARLVYLNLWDTNLGIWGAQAVGGLMADRACRIQYLNLGCNRLEFEGVVQLSGLYKNDSLVELDLSDNHLGPKGVHSLHQIMVRLQKDRACNIRRLNLSNNEINDVGCISIAKIIMGTVLTHLDLSFNRISDWGASTILASFESNELSLRDINMEANPLSFAGGVDICKILALPQSNITHLDLRGAKVTDVGVPYIAEALKSHLCPIISLNLYDCQLTDTGILKLAIKLSVNKSLRILGLGCNFIGDMGILALSQGLCLNSYLEELDLSENDTVVSRAGTEALMSAMRTNTSLLHLRLDIDPHPNVLSRSANDHNGVFGGFDQQHEHQYQHQHPDQQQFQHQYQQQQQQMLLTNNPHALAPTGMPMQVGEVLAPTHAALAQPLQVQPTATQSATGNHVGLLPVSTAHQQGGHDQAAFHNAEDSEQQREQLALAMSSLKTYVRHNYKRTTKMRKLCFEILVMARLLMFAKDAGLTQPSLLLSDPQRVSSVRRCTCSGKGEGCVGEIVVKNAEGSSLATITTASTLLDLNLSSRPVQTGLPTPPITNQERGLNSAGLIPGHLYPVDQNDDHHLGDQDVQDPSPSSPSSTSSSLLSRVAANETEEECPFGAISGHGPRGTLAGLPWEIKEMILKALDRDGLLSEPQFQTIMTYGASRWETVRKPWERWGEIRESILEKTRCYYYEH